MKVLVLGGGGQVARAVAATVPAAHSVVVLTRQDLDITDEAAVMSVVADSRVDWVVNGAAYTAVDLAEKQTAEATAINATAVGHVARAATRSGARLLHISTDFVFDGLSNRAYLPADPPHPVSAYGIGKLQGEMAALAAARDAIVLRTAWVYASSGRNFVLTMLRLMREREEIRVVCDQVGSPTWAGGLARAVWDFVEGTAGGIYHWTDLGVASWYDFAVAIQEEALLRGLLTRAIPVIPISTDAYPTPARRPAFSVLDSTSSRAAVRTVARHWRHNLRMMLDELRTE